jgi:CRISPR-associated endonuclease/helicase Cas3
MRFPIIGDSLPRNHGRAMFRAISRLIPEVASADWLLVKHARCVGRLYGAPNILARSRLRMRLPQSRVSLMLKLSGKRIDIGRHPVRFGTPDISLLKPCSSLYAKCVTIKGCQTPCAFLDALAWKLDKMSIGCEIELGLPCRFRSGGRVVIGFALTLHDLCEEDSIALQEQGLGSHRHLGCGFFVPVLRKLHKRAYERRLF